MRESFERLQSMVIGLASSSALVATERLPSRCLLCARLHRLLPGRCAAGLETVACSESGRWLRRDDAESEWRRFEHWAIDAVLDHGD